METQKAWHSGKFDSVSLVHLQSPCLHAAVGRNLRSCLSAGNSFLCVAYMMLLCLLCGFTNMAWQHCSEVLLVEILEPLVRKWEPLIVRQVYTWLFLTVRQFSLHSQYIVPGVSWLLFLISLLIVPSTNLSMENFGGSWFPQSKMVISTSTSLDLSPTWSAFIR